MEFLLLFLDGVRLYLLLLLLVLLMYYC